jgi:phosphohistidine phosphatase
VKRLWLLRHAKSSWDDAGLDDHDRPLAPRGRKAAKRIGRWAGDNGVRPQLALCSTAVRAHATLELALDGLGMPETHVEGGLYHASALALLDRLHDVPADIVEVLVVGHNPSLHDLVCTLAPPGPAAFPTGALAGLRLEIDEWRDLRRGCGTLAELVLPRSLTR